MGLLRYSTYYSYLKQLEHSIPILKHSVYNKGNKFHKSGVWDYNSDGCVVTLRVERRTRLLSWFISWYRCDSIAGVVLPACNTVVTSERPKTVVLAPFLAESVKISILLSSAARWSREIGLLRHSSYYYYYKQLEHSIQILNHSVYIKGEKFHKSGVWNYNSDSSVVTLRVERRTRLLS